MKVAILGSIPKGDEARKTWVDWKTEYVNKIREVLPKIEILDGDKISDNVGAELVVGHDLNMVKSADLIIVDAQKKIGAGTAQEIVIAKYFKKPVVLAIPPETHYRRSGVVFDGEPMEEWIHPFLKIASDYIADSINDAVIWAKEYFSNRDKIAVKDFSVYTDAIDKYMAEYDKIEWPDR